MYLSFTSLLRINKKNEKALLIPITAPTHIVEYHVIIERAVIILFLKIALCSLSSGLNSSQCRKFKRFNIFCLFDQNTATLKYVYISLRNKYNLKIHWKEVRFVLIKNLKIYVILINLPFSDIPNIFLSLQQVNYFSKTRQ